MSTLELIAKDIHADAKRDDDQHVADEEAARKILRVAPNRARYTMAEQ